jgi:hypothetical protein
VDDTDDGLETLGINVPFGLRQQLLTNAHQSIHKRIWIVDNSGSMNILDGHRVLAEHGPQGRDGPPSCSRWSEVGETVQCHARLSAALGAPTDFHLLNPPTVRNAGPLNLLRGQQKFRVGYGGRTRGPQHVAKDCRHAQNVMVRTEPNGKTPLAQAIADVRREIVELQPQLEAEQRKICLVIATDGSNYTPHNVDRAFPSVGGGGASGASGSNSEPLLENVHHITEEERQRDVIAALSSLQGLPVVVVIRLCTDHQPLVDFFSTCLDRAEAVEGGAAQTHQPPGEGEEDDGQKGPSSLCHDLIEVDIDVLDDHVAEAREVYHHNPWLNYALILHRMREMGQDHRLFDVLDERPLDRMEVRDFVSGILFGRTADHRWNVYDEAEWARFVEEVGMWQQKEHTQWNPLTRTMAPWIDTDALLAMPP